MKRMLYFAVGLMALVSTRGDAMDLDTARNQAFTNDFALAETAVQELQRNDDRATLLSVVKSARHYAIAIMAVAVLGEIGKKEEGQILVALLDVENRSVVEGGTEQKIEHDRMKTTLVEALAKICKADVPKTTDADTVSVFVSECKSKLNQLKE